MICEEEEENNNNNGGSCANSVELLKSTELNPLAPPFIKCYAKSPSTGHYPHYTDESIEDEKAECRKIKYNHAYFTDISILERRYAIKAVPFASGGYSKVFVGKDRISGEHVAVKRFFRSYEGDKNYAGFFLNDIQEIYLLHDMQHPHVINSIMSSRSLDNGLLMVLPLYDACLSDKLLDIIQVTHPDFHLTMINQIGSAIEYVHAINFIHRDIKMPNILVKGAISQDPNERLHFVLTDFGMALDCSTPDDTIVSTNVTTPQYAAPELMMKSRMYDSSIDVFAFGACIYYALTRDTLIRNDKNNLSVLSRLVFACESLGNPSESDIEWFKDHPDFDKLKTAVVINSSNTRGRRRIALGSVCAKIETLVSKMTSFCPTKRPTMTDVLQYANGMYQ